ncbi:hypothetical protein D3C72_987600 [compost metagenome]
MPREKSRNIGKLSQRGINNSIIIGTIEKETEPGTLFTGRAGHKIVRVKNSMGFQGPVKSIIRVVNAVLHHSPLRRMIRFPENAASVRGLAG